MRLINQTTVSGFLDRLEAEGIEPFRLEAARKQLSLQNCTVGYNPRLCSMAGRAKWLAGRMVIELNVELVFGEDAEERYKTFLHELAHLMCPEGAEHNWEWRGACLVLGIKPERCHQYATMQRRRR